MSICYKGSVSQLYCNQLLRTIYSDCWTSQAFPLYSRLRLRRRFIYASDMLCCYGLTPIASDWQCLYWWSLSFWWRISPYTASSFTGFNVDAGIYTTYFYWREPYILSRISSPTRIKYPVNVIWFDFSLARFDTAGAPDTTLLRSIFSRVWSHCSSYTRF